MITKIGKYLLNACTTASSNTIFPSPYTSTVSYLSNTAIIPIYDLKTATTRYASPLLSSVSNNVFYIRTNFNGGTCVVLGSGDSTPTENDTELDSMITGGITGTTPSITYAVDTENKMAIANYDYAITNTSNDSITIKEYGVVGGIHSAASSGGSLNSTAMVLMARELLNTPLTIPAGEARTLRLSFKFDYSSVMPS